MRRRFSLRGQAQFARLYRDGRKVQSGEVVLRYLTEPSGIPQFAFSASRSVGSAVVRNRVRRVLKEAVREDVQAWPPGLYHFRLKVKPSVVDFSHARDLIQNLRSMIGA